MKELSLRLGLEQRLEGSKRCHCGVSPRTAEGGCSYVPLGTPPRSVPKWERFVSILAKGYLRPPGSDSAPASIRTTRRPTQHHKTRQRASKPNWRAFYASIGPALRGCTKSVSR